LLPLGLDTLAVSLSLGIKSAPASAAREQGTRAVLPSWLRSALLFSLAETLMPLVGLLAGYAVSLAVSNVMHYVGALLLIGLGAWELGEEGRGYFVGWWRRRATLQKGQRDRGRDEGRRATERLSRFAWGRGRRATQASPPHTTSTPAPTEVTRFAWGRQVLLALSVSVDELAVGFSLGGLSFGRAIGPLVLCLYIGIQGFVMATVGIMLGRTIRARVKVVKEASELVGAVLLIGLGIGVLFFS
jgi:putative Mn2+ efflux pump MntP